LIDNQRLPRFIRIFGMISISDITLHSPRKIFDTG